VGAVWTESNASGAMNDGALYDLSVLYLPTVRGGYLTKFGDLIMLELILWVVGFRMWG